LQGPKKDISAAELTNSKPN